MTAWRYELTPRARRDLRRLAPDVRQRVFDALDRFVKNPSQGDVRKLAGVQDEWRLRVGDWRVRFAYDTDTRVIVVTRVLPRGRVYDR